MRCTGHPTATSESTASSCCCSSFTPRASLMAYSSRSPLYSRQRSMVGPRGLSFTSLWYRFRNACLRAVRRLKGLSSPLPSDPRQVLVGSRVHPYPVADADEERDLYDDPRLEGGRFGPPRRGVPLEARVRLRDREIDVRRRLHADDLTVGRKHGDGATLHDVPCRRPDDVGGHRHLIVGLGVHEVEQVSVPVEVRHRPRVSPHVLELLPRPEGLLDHGPAVYVPQPCPHERPALPWLDVLEKQDREPLAIDANGRAVPELVCGYHARKLPFTAPDLRNGPARRKPGADAGLLSHSFVGCQPGTTASGSGLRLQDFSSNRAAPEGYAYHLDDPTNLDGSVPLQQNGTRGHRQVGRLSLSTRYLTAAT